MPRVEVALGLSLNVEVEGAGPPLVLLHGFTGAAAGWGEFQRLLVPHVTTIAIDIVGHGQSDSPAQIDHYRMPQAVDDLVAAARLAGYRRASWLGYSMGGRTALHVAAAHPEAVQGLILIGASPGLADDDARAARVAADTALAARIHDEGLSAFVDYWESLPLFASQASLAADVRETIRLGRLACNPVGLANSLLGMGTGAQRPLHDSLSSLEMPVLALAGELDTRYTGIAREMAASVPSGKSASAPGAGHAAHLENPGWCAGQVIAFALARGKE